ncbi:Ubiquitin-conjugating enzyme E2 15 [Mortierella sp. GBA39]|nr:Ubiquitin-conjugating enzyme E2 15 [Mortierella sp. GBA39]
MASHSTLLLKKQLKGKSPLFAPTLRLFPQQTTPFANKPCHELTKSPVEGFSAGLVDDNNIFEWEIVIMGPQETLYEGGFYKATMTFPVDYPLMPPKLKFVTDMYHPNVYPTGEVCISILHPPGEDKYGYEQASERWTPVHTVETILISVISMLSSPNDESPANIEAAKEWRENYPSFKKKVQRIARRSAEDF